MKDGNERTGMNTDTDWAAMCERISEALLRSRADAARLAKAHGQKLIMGRNGAVVHVDPDEVLAQLDKLSRP